jgi:hypothetical protein
VFFSFSGKAHDCSHCCDDDDDDEEEEEDGD